MAQGVAVPDRFRFRIAARGMRGRFGYSKSETAKCRPVEDLSALNQTSGQERKQGAARSRAVFGQNRAGPWLKGIPFYY